MRLGIDASNIRASGGVTHLVEFLRAASPSEYGFSRVIVWGGKVTLGQVDDRGWLEKRWQPLLDKSLPYRTFWQRFRLSRLARDAKTDLLFVPGGSHLGDFHPIVNMSQNMLPFDWKELRRYGWSSTGMKLMMLRLIHSRSFRRADGLICVSEYARDRLVKVVKVSASKTTIIPYGVHARFCNSPREQLPMNKYSDDNPFRILYVSAIDVYKHQWHVAEAVAQLRREGLPVQLDLVGPAYPRALKRLSRVANDVDPGERFVRYSGSVPYGELHERYASAELCLFASSCESMPNVLLEGMASGLPIACSNRGPMPEILGDAGVYFDPEEPSSIADVLRSMALDPDLRRRSAEATYQRALPFTWKRCADETLSFLAAVAGTSSHASRPTRERGDANAPN